MERMLCPSLEMASTDLAGIRTLLRSNAPQQTQFCLFHNVRKLGTQTFCQIFANGNVLVELSLYELDVQCMLQLRQLREC
jgi:hypothetical protein